MTFSLIPLKNVQRQRVNLAVLALSISLASCGGGGSDGYFNNTSGSSGTGSGTGTGTTPVSAVNISNIEVLDVNNQLTRTVTVAGATAKVKVTDAAGKGISGALVTFSGTGVVFGTSNGSVLTNADGEASTSIKPTSSIDTGSYQLTATASFNAVTATAPAYNFSLQAANIVIANMVASTPSLESGASTNITLKTQDATTNSNQNNVSVTFTTSCGTFDNPTVVSSNQGDITTTYKAIDSNGKLCEGNQSITATGSNASITKSIQVNIAAITANSLVYTTAGAVNVVTKNSGSASSGEIEFTVYSNGTPAGNQDVNINLVRGPSDLSFVTEGNRLVKTLKSDASGKVTVNVYPGALPGPVEIKATLVANSNVFVLSKNVSVSTGRAYQSGLSISVSKNSLSGDIDGDTATLTARLTDRVGNPVPNGTVISFVTEGGSITPNCATSDGACTVTLSTQNPRPVDNRVSVLAYVEGDKAYTDVNGDNMYTAGTDQLVSNIGNFFRDDNENNVYDSNTGEFVYKRSFEVESPQPNCATSTINQPNIPGSCDSGLDAVLRDQILFAFADNSPTFNGLSGIDVEMTNITASTFSFQIYGNSLKTVPMPSATTVSVAVKDNTNFKPVATLTAKDASTKTLAVSGVEFRRADYIVSVKIGDNTYSVPIIANTGAGSIEVPASVTGTPEVGFDNQSCEAEIIDGFLTVPDVVNLKSPSAFALSTNDVVNYKIKTQQCSTGDEVRISVASPKGTKVTIFPVISR